MRVLSALDEPEAAVAEAAEALQRGEAIVLPTDTVYGLAALPSAVDKLAGLKDRPADMPIAVLVGGMDQATDLAMSTPAAMQLMKEHWPGSLTIVMARRDGGGTVGVRYPDHPFIRLLTAEVGPIAATSANRHGEPTPPTALEAAAALTGEVALVIDGGPCEGTASTVVDASVDPPVVLRTGPICL